MNVKDLTEWSENHRIIERTRNGFVNYLENWKKDDRGDFFDTFRGKSNLKVIEPKFYSLQLTHINGYSDFVYCNLVILYLGKDIGVYRMVFTLQGEVDEDAIHFVKYIDNTIY